MNPPSLTHGSFILVFVSMIECVVHQLLDHETPMKVVIVFFGELST